MEHHDKGSNPPDPAPTPTPPASDLSPPDKYALPGPLPAPTPRRHVLRTDRPAAPLRLELEAPRHATPQSPARARVWALTALAGSEGLHLGRCLGSVSLWRADGAAEDEPAGFRIDDDAGGAFPALRHAAGELEVDQPDAAGVVIETSDPGRAPRVSGAWWRCF